MAANILFVGCGNIGSRLLQSVAGVQPDVTGAIHVFVYEPFCGARDVAQARFGEAVGERPHQLSFIDGVADVQDRIDLAVIPTDARNRLTALREALTKRPKRVLLEKFLFTQSEDYASAADALAAAGAEAFVNASRNEWDGYKALKRDLGGRRIKKLSAVGGDWNLASNGVHFLTLLSFLNDAPITSVELADLGAVRDAKRGGYREFVGSLVAHDAAGNEARLDSLPGAPGPIAVALEVDDGTCTDIDEAGGVMTYRGADKIEQRRDFKMNFASQLDDMFARLIGGAETSLPTYEESTKLHLLLMAAMNEAFHGARNLDAECPVT